MKRLVVCCDGTWQAETNPTVSNIVKIAQSVSYQTETPAGDLIPQWVTYLPGPGSHGFLADRLLGGAFGEGLVANMALAYWHLTANWEPGDEIYVFGFSRGAFTARTVVGLIHRIGMLTPEAMMRGKFAEAVRLYELGKPRRRFGRRRRERGIDPELLRRFRADNCYQEPVTIDFLGVFDTVGALGVPGLSAAANRFHDVRLPTIVRCARQALSIDERRRAFQPCLWEIPDEPDVTYPQGRDRVRQVWFSGVHTDIGGGYLECGLSNITLRWMVDAAEAAGLVFDRERLETLASECERIPNLLRKHDSLSWGYRILNFLRFVRNPGDERFYWDSWRRLSTPEDQAVRIASTVPLDDGASVNVQRWRARYPGEVPESAIERITAPTTPPEVARTPSRVALLQ